MTVVIETRRLSLRRQTVDDAPFILRLLNDADFLRHIGDRGVRSVEDAEAYIRDGAVASYEAHGFGLYVVESNDGGKNTASIRLLEGLGFRSQGLIEHPDGEDVHLYTHEWSPE